MPNSSIDGSVAGELRQTVLRKDELLIELKPFLLACINALFASNFSDFEHDN